MYRPAEQGGQGDPRFFAQLLDQRQLALLAGHQAFLLGQFQGGGGAGVIAGLHQVEHVARVGQVQLGDLLALPRGQGLRVAVGDAAEQGQFHRGLVERAGAQTLQGAVAGGGAATPEIHFVAGGEVGAVVIDGVIVACCVQVRATWAAQQFLAAGGEVEFHLRQQRRAGDDCAGLGLAHAGRGGGHVETVPAGLVDQAVQLRAAELCPPLLLGGLGRVALGVLPGGRRCDAAVDGRRVAGAGAEQYAEAGQVKGSFIHWSTP